MASPAVGDTAPDFQLPGTGGLTRLVDKRGVRRDLADLFCTTAEGVRAERAKAWNLVDDSAPPPKTS